MSKRRRLNGGFLFVHKRSVADAISVDRDDRSDENFGEGTATQGLGGGRWMLKGK
jgi:hypothetical protein